MARSLHERLFAWMLLADERNVAATYVRGCKIQLAPQQSERWGGGHGDGAGHLGPAEAAFG
jgi:guanine deaminase